MKREEDRRSSKRIAFLRPIYYFSDKSDKFISATMLNFCPTGICFQSGPPLAPGEQLYIITGEKPDGNLFDNSSKAIVGKVVWCRRSVGAHHVGVQYIGHPLSEIDKERNLWSRISVAGSC